jgi:hypothetical protein
MNKIVYRFGNQFARGIEKKKAERSDKRLLIIIVAVLWVAFFIKLYNLF